MWLLNASYQWGCTARACDEDGVPWLLRTLDWPFHGLGRHAEVARMRGAAGDFFSVTWPGYVGALTALAPSRFAACVNQAPMRRRTAHRWLRGYDLAANAVAVWRSDDAAGAVKIISPGRDVTGASIASDLISVDPKLCKGNFGAARSSEVVDGAVVFRAALSCVEGEDNRTAQYFVTPRQRGGFVVFAVIGNNAAGESAPNRLKPDLLGRAALLAAKPGG